MKNLIFFLLMVICLPLKALNNPNDTIDFNKFDTTLFIKCFVELCNQERGYLKLNKVEYSNIGNKAASYHLNYIVDNNKFTHFQYENNMLMLPEDRFLYFSTDINLKYDSELLFNTFLSKKYTYYELAESAIDGFMSSKVGHKECILSSKENLLSSMQVSFKKNNKKVEFYSCVLFFY